MQRWEYCDVTWQPDRVVVTTCRDGEEPTVKAFQAQAWPQLLAKMGMNGWEMVTGIGSPVGIHEYFFYFKRPVSAGRDSSIAASN